MIVMGPMRTGEAAGKSAHPVSAGLDLSLRTLRSRRADELSDVDLVVFRATPGPLFERLGSDLGAVAIKDESANQGHRGSEISFSIEEGEGKRWRAILGHGASRGVTRR